MDRHLASPVQSETSVGQLPGVSRRHDDLLLVAREAATGSAAAVRTLVMHVGPPMLATVRKVLGAHHPDVDDVAQDSVIALLDALPGFRGDSSVMTFAHRVALLTALAARRRTATRQKYVDSAAAQLEPTTERSTPQSVLMAKRRRALLLQLLDELPQPIAEALALHFVLGMTVDEIAANCSAPENTVWSRLRLGKQSLRRKLAEDGAIADILAGAE